jgi:hypothetical protein
MLRGVLAHMRHNVVAYVALFFALTSSSALALDGMNTVFSDDIVNGEVKSVDIGNDEIQSGDVKDGTINTFDVHSFLGVDVVDNSLTGADVDETTLNLAAEPWHEIGAPGQPGFNVPVGGNDCGWRNYDPPNFNTAAFLRDRSGFVHLKGMVEVVDGQIWPCGEATDRDIFTLPAGYRPARVEVFAALSNWQAARVNVLGIPYGLSAGSVAFDYPAFNDAREWLSLDGIIFRCAPSGQSGCP